MGKPRLCILASDLGPKLDMVCRQPLREQRSKSSVCYSELVALEAVELAVVSLTDCVILNEGRESPFIPDPKARDGCCDSRIAQVATCLFLLSTMENGMGIKFPIGPCCSLNQFRRGVECHRSCIDRNAEGGLC